MLNSIIVSITSQLPAFLANGAQMVVTLLQGVAQTAPQLIAAFFNMLNSIITSITAQLPTFLANGAQMIVALLQGIAQQIPNVVPAAMNTVTTSVKAPRASFTDKTAIVQTAGNPTAQLLACDLECGAILQRYSCLNCAYDEIARGMNEADKESINMIIVV